MSKIWTRLSHYGINENLSNIASRKAILTNQLAYILFFVIFSLNISFLFIDVVEFNPVSLFASLFILIVPSLNKWGYYKFSSFTFSIIAPIASLVFSTISKTLMPPPVPLISYIVPKIILISFLVLPLILIDSRNKLLLILSISVNIVCIFLADYAAEYLGVGLDYSNVSLAGFNRLNILILFPITIFIFAFVFLNSINNKAEDKIISQNRRLEIANSKIEGINRDLTDSIEYAEYIQKAILPSPEILNECFVDSFVYYKPKSIVSGDFYFFKECILNNQKFYVISAADCTGHGVPGGFLSMLGVSLLLEILRVNNFNDAADILNQMRHNIKTALNQTGEFTEQKDGIEMALVIYYPEQNIMQYAGAKNPLYIIDANQKLIVYKANTMPIGIHIVESPFTNHEIKLNGNEMVYLFTDGILDQINLKGTKLMTKRFQNILLDNSPYECSKQKEQFISQLNQWMSSGNHEPIEQIDDMLLIGFKIKKT